MDVEPVAFGDVDWTRLALRHVPHDLDDLADGWLIHSGDDLRGDPELPYW